MIGGPACRECAYPLAGLGARGRCPECGVEYPPVREALTRRPRSAWAMCVMFGWPLAGAGFGLLLAWGASWGPLRYAHSTGLMTFSLMMVALLVNTPVQAATLLVHHARPGQRLGNPLEHLTKGGAAAVLLVAGAPLAIMGLCVLALLVAAVVEMLRGR